VPAEESGPLSPRLQIAGILQQNSTDVFFHVSSTSAGLSGSHRPVIDASQAERARCAVTKRIKQAIEKIADAIPTLGHHLTARIKTGYFCSYNPHPDRPVAWKF
jgi:hypothetical protein